MAVQQHVLNWLYSVLTSEYHDVGRTYNDVAQALAHFPSLAPRTDVHTFPNGASALLVHLAGTLPAGFRGATYRYPVSLWLPHSYPREPPLVYVTPTDTMVVRPGQHVDPQGQVYHPYLAGWAEFWDKSTVVDFLTILRDVFAKEPPVMARPVRASTVQRPAQTSVQTPVQTPVMPPVMTQAQPPVMTQPPPPRPPHPTQTQPQELATPTHQTPQPVTAPPPPPKGHQATQKTGHSTPSPPPVPPHPTRSASGSFSGVSGPAQMHSSHTHTHTSAPTPPPSTSGAPPVPGRPRYQSPLGQPPMSPVQTLPLQALQALQPLQAPLQQQQAPLQPLQPLQQPPQYARPKQPVPDIMDEPLQGTGGDRPNAAPRAAPETSQPPPVPPNPEKDALLHRLAQQLSVSRQQTRAKHDATLAGLHAQRSAMRAAATRLQQDMSDVAQLSALLTTNTDILHASLAAADDVVARSTTTPVPAVDELLVGPTVVANQLYDLVAEERALADAIFVLGRAVERGRVSPAVFAKMTRSLAREWYFKKALVRKIGRGMGLAGA